MDGENVCQTAGSSRGHDVIEVIKKTVHCKISSMMITGYIVVLIIHNPFKLRQS